MQSYMLMGIPPCQAAPIAVPMKATVSHSHTSVHSNSFARAAGPCYAPGGVHLQTPM